MSKLERPRWRTRQRLREPTRQSRLDFLHELSGSSGNKRSGGLTSTKLVAFSEPRTKTHQTLRMRTGVQLFSTRLRPSRADVPAGLIWRLLTRTSILSGLEIHFCKLDADFAHLSRWQMSPPSPWFSIPFQRTRVGSLPHPLQRPDLFYAETHYKPSSILAVRLAHPLLNEWMELYFIFFSGKAVGLDQVRMSHRCLLLHSLRTRHAWVSRRCYEYCSLPLQIIIHVPVGVRTTIPPIRYICWTHIPAFVLVAPLRPTPLLPWIRLLLSFTLTQQVSHAGRSTTRTSLRIIEGLLYMYRFS